MDSKSISLLLLLGLSHLCNTDEMSRQESLDERAKDFQLFTIVKREAKNDVRQVVLELDEEFLSHLEAGGRAVVAEAAGDLNGGEENLCILQLLLVCVDSSTRILEGGRGGGVRHKRIFIHIKNY
jgi:hypothetical protein